MHLTSLSVNAISYSNEDYKQYHIISIAILSHEYIYECAYLFYVLWIQRRCGILSLLFFSLQVKFKLPGRTIFIKLLLQNLTDFCYLSDSLAVYHSSNALQMFLQVMGQESRGLFDQIRN